MIVITDTREQAPLEFIAQEGIEFQRSCLPVGDYAAIHKKSGPDSTIFERKSIGDLWGSFSGENYVREKEKIKRAKDMGLNYVLAVEATPWKIREGHEYFSGGEIKRSKKDGLTMLRQLCTVERKYGVTIKYFNGRKEMAFYIVEFFLAQERIDTT